jgi:hypothetical protein
LKACVAKLPELDHPTRSIMSKVSDISARVRGLTSSSKGDVVLTAARDLVVCVETWAKASNLARKRTGSAESDQSRIWLPVPQSMAPTAEKLGASKDDTGDGASPFFVSTGTPLAIYDALLPLGYRHVVPKLSFADNPGSAGRDRLANFIDPMTWDHVSSVNVAMTGRRCILCGKQVGTLGNKIAPRDHQARTGVTCHEVWSWSRPDPAIPVGIQSLERILVLCFDCRMCFKEEEALASALAVGEPGLERGVQGYLLKRRAFLTRTGPKDVAAQMRSEQAMLAANADITTWIVDIGKLARQDYMYGHTPTLMLGNSARVKPSNLAGMAFRDTEGKTHPAVSADRVYQAVAMKWIVQPQPSFKVVGKP